MAKDALLDDAPSPAAGGGKAPKGLVPDSKGPTRPMARLILVARILGLALGASVALVGLMGLFGTLSDHLAVRLVGALVVAIGLPTLLADRALRAARGGGLGLVIDVFAITLLAMAIAFVALGGTTSELLAREGDRHARDGKATVARFAYFVAGVTPSFPGDEGYRGKCTGR